MLQGRVALIQRGMCSFKSKVKLAQDAGATGAVIYNNMQYGSHTAPLTMADDGAVAGVTIPSVMVGSFAGLELTALVRSALSPPDVRVTIPVVGGGSAGIADFSSRGPMEDKRIKPDIMAPGTGIMSAASDGSLSSPNQCSSTDVVEMSGTSMATPIVAGAAGIVRQYFEEGRLMNGMRDALAKRSFAPSAALVKALIIHSGTPLIESNSFGMGTGSEVRSLRPHIFVA